MLAGRLLTSHRAVETALLGSRGAAGWQLARITMAEIAVVGGIGAAGGALAGTRLASLLAGAGSLRDARLRLAGFPGSAWLAVALVLALCLAITLWPALRPATPGAVAARRGRPAAIAGIARSGGDIAIIVLALIAVRELRTYSAVAHLPTGGLGIDPVLSAAPALALAAASLILLRLLPLAARAMERLIARSRHLGAALASWQISRRTVTQSGPVLLAVLAVATGTLALAQYQSWQRSARDQAAFAAGADVRVATARPASLGRAGAISHAPGVAAAMPVTVEPTALHGTLLAVGCTSGRPHRAAAPRPVAAARAPAMAADHPAPARPGAAGPAGQDRDRGQHQRRGRTGPAGPPGPGQRHRLDPGRRRRGVHGPGGHHPGRWPRPSADRLAGAARPGQLPAAADRPVTDLRPAALPQQTPAQQRRAAPGHAHAGQRRRGYFGDRPVRGAVRARRGPG